MLGRILTGCSRNGFWEWYETCRHQDGIHHLTEAVPFAHNEEWYADQFASDVAVGKGAIELLCHLGADVTKAALEIGCGAGALSCGLAQQGVYPRLILTDPSVSFLKITRRQLNGLNPIPLPEFAVMFGEQISLFPDDSLSLVVMRYTLHHIWDLDAFFTECSRVLVPGGVLLFEEPHASFFTHAAAMLHFMAPAAESKNVDLPDNVLDQIDIYLRTIENYVRGDIDKSMQEDKHLFSTETIQDLAEKNGFKFKFVLNRSLASFADAQQRNSSAYFSHGSYDFYKALRYYLVEIMRFGESIGFFLDSTIKAYCEHFSGIFRGTTPPPHFIIGACLKKGRSSQHSEPQASGAAQNAKMDSP